MNLAQPAERVGEKPFECDTLVRVPAVCIAIRYDEFSLFERRFHHSSEMSGMIRSKEKCFGDRVGFLGDRSPDRFPYPCGTWFTGEYW